MPVLVSNRLRTAAVVTAVAAAGLGFTVRHQANALRANELAQQRNRTLSTSATASGPATPNLYVSVDRSGGGI